MTKWISIKDRLPKHKQTILAYFKNCESNFDEQCIVIFIDTAKMNKNLWKNGLSNQKIDPKITPYYFYVPNEKKDIFCEITHWQPLKKAPE